MKIEIDQSGKIENTSKHTFIAFSNSKHLVLKISASEKRKLQKHFRSIGKPRLFIPITFAALISLLLRDVSKSYSEIIIDTEYPGKSALIKDMICSISPALKNKNIRFHQIGKHSNAHYLAYGTALDKMKPDQNIKALDIIKQIKRPRSA